MSNPAGVETINIGFGNYAASARVVAVVGAGSSPLRRLVDLAAKDNRLVDATSGRRTRSIIVTDSNHVILSHTQPSTIARKLAGREPAGDEPIDDDRDET